MVDRATRYQNAMNQIQERNKPGHAVVDIPPDTHERHVKAVRRSICVRVCIRLSQTSFACTGASTYENMSNR